MLDTQVLLWWMEGSARLGAVARETLSSRDSIVWVSAVAVWEIAIKAALGRLTMREAPEVAVPRVLELSGFRRLEITIEHALAVRLLPHHHGDPFDRMLVSQASLEGLRLVTADGIFDRYGVDVLNASR